MTKPIMVIQCLGDLDVWGSFNEVINQLNRIKEQHPEYTNFRCEPYHYDGDSSVKMYADRPETPEERQERLDKPKRDREQRRAEYERLKAEFEREE